MPLASAPIDNLYYTQVVLQILWVLKHIYNFVVPSLWGKSILKDSCKGETWKMGLISFSVNLRLTGARCVS